MDKLKLVDDVERIATFALDLVEGISKNVAECNCDNTSADFSIPPVLPLHVIELCQCEFTALLWNQQFRLQIFSEQ